MTNCGGACSDGETQDCNGHCFPAEWIGDGECDNGFRQHDTETIYLNCEEFGWDGGDCTPSGPVPVADGACCIGDQTDCADRVCEVLDFWDCTLNDGVFLGEYTSCTDATCDCPPGMVADCQGQCFSLYLLGDGLCHEGARFRTPGTDDWVYLSFGCIEIGCDGGDCIGVCAGACCVGTDCLPGLSVIACAEAGGVFLGTASSCELIDCIDHVSTVVLTEEVSLPALSSEQIREVAAGGGLMVAAVQREPHENDYWPAAHIWNSSGQWVGRVLAQQPGSATPVIDTDGTRVVLAAESQVSIFNMDSGASLEQTINFGATVIGVAVSGDMIAIWNSGEVKIWRLSGGTWSFDLSIQPESSIDDLDLDGNVLAIVDAVRMTVLERQGGEWVGMNSWSVDGQEGTVAVSLNRVILGELATNSQGVPMPGQARIFRSTDGLWNHEATLVPSQIGGDDLYGSAVAIDGDIALVGAPRNDLAALDCGKVLLFELVGDSWTQLASIIPEDPLASMKYGSSVGCTGRSVIAHWQRGGDLWVDEDGAQVGRIPQAMWINAKGGSWGDSSNWAPVAPISDEAHIALPAAFDVTVDGYLGVDNLHIGPSRPTFTGSGAALGASGGQLSVAGSRAFSGQLTLSAPLAVSGDVLLGDSRKPGQLTVSDSGSLTITGDLEVDKEGQLVLLVDGSSPVATVSGEVLFNGALEVRFSEDVADPQVGQVIPLMALDSLGEGIDVPLLITPGLGAGKYLALDWSLGAAAGGVLNMVVHAIDGLNDLGDATDTSVSGMVTDIVVVDLTSESGGPDGFDDIALTIAGEPGYVMILVNDGSGGVSRQVGHAVTADPTSIDAGDFNGDGLSDLVFAFQSSDQIQTLMNTGLMASDMTLGPVVATGDRPVDLASILLMGDTFDDVLVVCAGTGEMTPDGIYDGLLEVYESDGNALRSGLTLSQSIALGEVPGQVKPGKVGSGKGTRRAVVTLKTSNSAAVFADPTEDGAVNFQLSQQVEVGAEPGSLVIGDFNGDDIEDLFVGNAGSNTVSTMLGVSGTEFGQQQLMVSGHAPSNLTTLDYDGDGDLDLAMRTLYDDGSPLVTVYRNDTALGGGGLVFAMEQVLDDPIQLIGAGRMDADETDDLVTVTDGVPLRGAGGSDVGLVGIRSADVSGTSCPGDINNDQIVDVNDLLLVIAGWGTAGGDINGDGSTDVEDVLAVISSWGACA
ncbi:MAG: FG-GAP-like repeat-containing protein [Phycisphaerales bacterium]|nr:FG-GAP-like repeat-containing protein [Phycisphaerales bacterium]